MLRINRVAVAVGLGIVLASTPIIANASIPDQSGVIHGCYNTAHGQVRIIDTATSSCLANETAVQWSQTGPQGSVGPQGAQGPIGPQGPAGTVATSNVWFASLFTTPLGAHPIDLGNTDQPVTVLTLHVNAGSYTVEGSVILKNFGLVDSSTTGYCQVTPGVSGADFFLDGSPRGTNVEDSSDQLELTTAVTLPAGGDIVISCTENSSSLASTLVMDATLLATPVGAVTPFNG